MTEPEWLKSTEPLAMLEFLRGRADGRKLRLFLIACCRQVEPLLTDSRSGRAVEAAEQYLAGAVDLDELQRANRAAEAALSEVEGIPDGHFLGAWVADLDADNGAWTTARITHRPSPAEKCEVLRELFGNPFRPVRIDPAWLTTRDRTVTRLARAIAESGRFDELPILADALEEAGCDNGDLLSHLRGVEPHVAGCWALDLVTQRCERPAVDGEME